MIRRIALVWLLGTALCAALVVPPAAADPRPARVDPDIPYDCPPIMRGVSLVLKPISGGVTLDFTSQRLDQTRELRKQLRDAAIVVELHSKAPPDETSEPPVVIPPIKISVDDLGAGARVTIRPERAADIAELRELAQALESIWTRANCGGAPKKRLPIPTVRA